MLETDKFKNKSIFTFIAFLFWQQSTLERTIMSDIDELDINPFFNALQVSVREEKMMLHIIRTR